MCTKNLADVVQAKPSLQIFAPFDGFAALPETAFVMQLRGYSSTGPVLIAKEQVQAMDLDQHRSTWKVRSDMSLSAFQNPCPVSLRREWNPFSSK